MFAVRKRISAEQITRTPEAGDTGGDVLAQSNIPDRSAHQLEAAAVLATIQMVEEDVLRVVKDIDETAEVARNVAVNAGQALQDIHAQSEKIGQGASQMASDIIAIASATEQLSGSADSIARIVSDASENTDKAATNARKMGDSFEQLSQAASEIGSILNTMFSIARQTNLLALNAKIEAARAGEAGRGFAVVANEVNELSAASERAAVEIRQLIEVLQSRVGDATGQAREVVKQIADVTPLFAAVEEAVNEQRKSSSDLAQQVNHSATFAKDVRDDMQSMGGLALKAAELNAIAEQASTKVSTQVEDLGRRFVTVMRQTKLANRRQLIRLPVDLPLHVSASGMEIDTKTIDMSIGGLLIEPRPEWHVRVGDNLIFMLADLPQTRARIVGISKQGIHCSFEHPSDDFKRAIKTLFDRLEDESRPLIETAQKAAGDIGRIFEDMISSGAISEETLFSSAYTLVEGSNPKQFTTPALSRLETWLTPLQERLSESDKRIVFCSAVDRNGYLPVHNLKFSKPQRPDDPIWNMANSRNRRIFDDRAGLTCARSTQAYMIHAYHRDMGENKIEVLKEYVAPITVNGRHWGGFRCAYRL